MAESWDDLDSQERGHVLGQIIGKFGIDVFAPLGTVKEVQHFRELKRANTVLTLERLAASRANEAKILEKATKVGVCRKKLLESAKSGKIIARSINQRHHIMQPHHAWDRLVKLSGNEEKDFKAVVKVLEESGIFSKACMVDEIVQNQMLTLET